MKLFCRLVIIWLLGSCFCGINRGEAPRPGLSFEEVFKAVRGGLTNLSEADANSLAINGFISALKGQAALGPQPLGTSLPTNAEPTIARKTVHDNFFAYIRLARISGSTEPDFWQAYQDTRATNRLRGLVLDLRFADGMDYEMAARVADHFVANEVPLLKLGDKTVQSTPKTNAVNIPVAVLVNKETSGAAEALAAMLRQADAALLIGSSTAGRALEYQEVHLSNGQILRLAKAPVRVGDFQTLTTAGLAPDILVGTPLQEERAALEDPFKLSLKNGLSQAPSLSTNLAASRFPRRGLNEAELVRRHREGLDPEGNDNRNDEAQVVMTDAALARALDFLKGIAVAQRLRSP
jgi:hypothetical protein